jgi:hypothetical protein
MFLLQSLPRKPLFISDIRLASVMLISLSTSSKKEAAFMKRALPSSYRMWIAIAVLASLFTPEVYAGNEVMAEIQFQGKSKVEKTSGVWVDGQYVGYLKELKGSKKVLLMPGEHVITVRQHGYRDFTERLVVQPGETQVVQVAMVKAPMGVLPEVTSTVKISVNPSRAAVFLDGSFVGHVGEFQGVGRGLVIAPGAHKIKIALPGYKTFETDINPQGDQKVEVKTELVKDEVPVDEPLLKTGNDHGAQASAANPPASPQR